MLKPEQAQERLKQFQVKDWEKQRLAAVAKLPKQLCEVGYGILGRDASGKESRDWAKRSVLQKMVAEQLDAMKPNERLKVFEALFPKVASYMEGAWQLHYRLPYQVGYERKAFRAPNAPHITRYTCSEWLTNVVGELKGYDEDVRWFAAWAPHLGVYGGADQLGILFAAALDAGGKEGDEVFDILRASATNEHEIGGMGRHVTRAMLCSSRPEAWDFIERLLLAAQRQEGLRQVILESIDEAHPEAFRRMLRLIRENDLMRFSATVRAVNVWFGLMWDSISVRVANNVIERVLKFLDDVGKSSICRPAERDQAIADADAETAYLALWTLGFDDAETAIAPAVKMLNDKNVERRFVAAHFLHQLGIPQAKTAMLPALDDEDLRIVDCVLGALRGGYGDDEKFECPDLFERLERILPRFPKKRTQLKPIVWEWAVYTVSQAQVADMLDDNLGKRPATRLIPYLPMMSSYNRGSVIQTLAKAKKWDDQTRDTLFVMVGDLDRFVRERALEGLQKCKVTEREAVRLEGFLTRKSGDLRRGVLSLLLNQPDAQALASADRLLTSKDALQRLAGIEILRQMAEANRAADQCRARAEQFQSSRKMSNEESKQLDAILDTGRKVATLDDALGLMNPDERTKPVPPQKRKVTFFTKAAAACIESLDGLIHKHRATPIIVEGYDDQKEEVLLGNVGWRFPSPDTDVAIEDDIARLPLREVWEKWWVERPKEQRDSDGLELLRALAAVSIEIDSWSKPPSWVYDILKVFRGDVKVKKLRHDAIVKDVLAWLVRLHSPAGAADFLLDTVETTFTLIPEKERTRAPKDEWDEGWRGYDYRDHLLVWLVVADRHRDLYPSEWSYTHQERFWGLLRWMDEPAPNVLRHRPYSSDVLTAFQAGIATEADVLDHLLGPRKESGSYRSEFDSLREWSARKPPKEFEQVPALRDIVERCRQRIIEVECDRGDTPTAASQPALALRYAGGLDTLVRLLQAFGKENFVRGYAYDNLSKSSVFSYLIRCTFPAESDTPDEFAKQVKAAKIPEQRLIETAMYAPQWARHVEHCLKWKQFEEAVWWIHAHTKDTHWSVDNEIREAWSAQVTERTPLSAADLTDGAVDVAWFWRVYDALKEERWNALDDAAKYASSAGGHKRAQLFADAMRGRLEKKELMKSIKEKRNQDAVRALGLVPLEGSAGILPARRQDVGVTRGQDARATRGDDLLERYEVIQEFLRTSKQFGSQRQESEKRAATIGLENLARTAGYPDPQRLEWAMEARAIADLAEGALSVSVGGVDVTVKIDEFGQPDLSISKQGKPLKTVPPAVRKDPKFVALRERNNDLRKQVSRMRQSLEGAMIRGDAFTGAELRDLFKHPVLAPMLERLALVGDGIIGYPMAQGQALRNHAGKREATGKNDKLRIAHPHDLLTTKEWHLWQRECFLAERIQPFKQVFRELYVITEQEKKDGTISKRYEAHQVNPRQAMALLGGRGWVAHPEEGVRRTFHDAGISAWLSFHEYFFTPADVEGLTLEGVRFTKRGEWESLKLTDVPPRLFSEVMRDLDLVVSVAHRGGVDPEASASTVEMRASLLRETVGLLNLSNVRVEGNHALISGHLSDYSVHLGSANVHLMPGGYLCIVPVHAQHRGRLFLPFADDDPKTAEVLSKVLLLSRDTEIQDPNILDQIRAVR